MLADKPNEEYTIQVRIDRFRIRKKKKPDCTTRSLLRFLIKKSSFAAKVEIDSVKSNPIVVLFQGRSNELFITVFQFPDFCWKPKKIVATFV